MLCASQLAVRECPIIIFSFFQERIKFAGCGVGLQLSIPGGGIERCKPTPELSQGRGLEGFDGLLQGFHIGHGLSAQRADHQFDGNEQQLPPSNRQPHHDA